MLSVRMRGFFMDCHASLAMTKEVGDVDCHGRACALPRNDKAVGCNDIWGGAMTRCVWEFDNMAFINKTK